MIESDDFSNNSGPLFFMKGGGDMGSRMRAMDWSTSSLGPPENWPQSLIVISFAGSYAYQPRAGAVASVR